MEHKQVAQNAVKTAWNFLYEVETLREVASYIAEHHDDGDCEEIGRQVDVLNNIADERIHSALEAIDMVDDYFQEKPVFDTDTPALVASEEVQ